MPDRPEALSRVRRAAVPAPGARRGVALALGATGLWSTTGIFIDPLVSRYHLTPVQLTFWRCLFVVAALLVQAAGGRRQATDAGKRFSRLSPLAPRLTGREVPYYIAYGLGGLALFNVAWSASVAVNKAAVATALLYCAPVFVALGAWALYRERVSAAQSGAIVINLIGCALVAGASHTASVLHNPAGLAWGLASGATYAAYILFGKGAARLSRRGTPTVLFYTFGIAALGLLAFGLLTQGPALLTPRLDLWGWLLLVGLSLGPTLAGYALFTASLAHLSSTVASLLTTLEPPITAVLALVLLGRVMSPSQWLGTALIVTGVLLIQGDALRGRGGKQATQDRAALEAKNA